jgi:hypothetical protein
VDPKLSDNKHKEIQKKAGVIGIGKEGDPNFQTWILSTQVENLLNQLAP